MRHFMLWWRFQFSVQFLFFSIKTILYFFWLECHLLGETNTSMEQLQQKPLQKYVSMIRYNHEKREKSQTFQVKSKKSKLQIFESQSKMFHSLFQFGEEEIFLLYVPVSSTAIVLIANLYLYWPWTFPHCLKYFWSVRGSLLTVLLQNWVQSWE